MKKGALFFSIVFLIILYVSLYFVSAGCSTTSSYSNYRSGFDCCKSASPFNQCTAEKQCWNCNNQPWGSVRCAPGTRNDDCYGDCGDSHGAGLCPPLCTPSCACATNTCVGQTCGNGCGGTCAGTKGTSDNLFPFSVNINPQGSYTFNLGKTIYSSTIASAGWTDYGSACIARVSANSLTGPDTGVASPGKGSVSGALGTVSAVTVTETNNCYASDGTPRNAMTVTGIIVNGCISDYVCTPYAEICDYMDNDCDGQVDEGNICLNLNSTYWANLKGENISSSEINDTVLMIAEGTELDTKVLNYTIVQRAGSSWNPLNWFDHTILKTSVIGISDWKIQNDGTFYFMVMSGGKINFSSDMVVSSSVSDSSPVADIISPSTPYFTSVNYSILFTQSSYDADDLINLVWDFGDGTSAGFSNYSLVLNQGEGNVYHNYSTAGIYHASLTALESGRANPKSSSDYVTIYVLQPNVTVFPVISSPNSSAPYGNWVTFNASKSFVVNCTKGVIANRNFTAGDLNCTYIHAPLQKTITGNYDMWLNWTVYDPAGRIDREFIPRRANWKTNYSYIVEFPIYFEDSNTRNAILSITYS
jgi:hypothetical protein